MLIQQMTNWWYFSYFSQKKNLTIHANLSPLETICIYVKTCFLQKIRKNISICCLLKILPRVLSINIDMYKDLHLSEQNTTLFIGQNFQATRGDIREHTIQHYICFVMAKHTLTKKRWQYCENLRPSLHPSLSVSLSIMLSPPEPLCRI